MERIIEFSAFGEYVKADVEHPTPIKFNLPKWHKDLEHSLDKQTVKGCMPFLDSMTSGYLLKVPQEMNIKWNHPKENNEKEFSANFPTEMINNLINVNTKNTQNSHDYMQFKGSSFHKNEAPSFKILNPWRIKTPPGYSCLFLPPLNNPATDKFEILPGIVDTDTYTSEINFPIKFNFDKYESFNFTLKRGTPYVQVIPFKREPWKMKIEKSHALIKLTSIHFNLFTKLFKRYQTLFWSKKSWK